MTKLKEKIKEALSSVLPITAIVVILSVTITPMPIGMMLLFLLGAFLLVAGMGFFSLGADISMMPMGDGIGNALVSMGKKRFMIPVVLALGIIITIAEPDLGVLAHQVPGVPDQVLIWTVALGVGIFLVCALLRIVYRLDLKYMLLICYAVVFLLTYVSMDSFLAVAFDSGGVTTGPITVPFIMALGVGMANIRNDQAEEESFGMVALCSIGPILAVLLLGILYHPQGATYTPFEMAEVETSQDVIKTFLVELPHYIVEVSTALFPILCFFILFQLITAYFKKKKLMKLLIGSLYTFIGLIMFLCGVNVGFMPAGYFIGAQIAALPYHWILVPIGMIIGFFIVKAEPAVHVLNRQVEEVSSGSISAQAMLYSLSIGVSISVGIAMLRVLTGIHIMFFLIPGYVISILLSFYVPKVFTGIAFDSGGVASGPMTAAFLLPFAMGACESVGGSVLMDAFGIVAMVAMTPLITIQILGFLTKKKKSIPAIMSQKDEIISFKEDQQDETTHEMSDCHRQ